MFEVYFSEFSYLDWIIQSIESVLEYISYATSLSAHVHLTSLIQSDRISMQLHGNVVVSSNERYRDF